MLLHFKVLCVKCSKMKALFNYSTLIPIETGAVLNVQVIHHNNSGTV